MKMFIVYSACKQLMISLGTERVIPVCNFESECQSLIWPTSCSEMIPVLTVHTQDPPGIWGYLPQVSNPPGCEPWPWSRSRRQHGCQFDNGGPDWCTPRPTQSQGLQESSVGMPGFKSGFMHSLHKVDKSKPSSWISYWFTVSILCAEVFWEN
jgi:hypothetical protein